MAFAVYVVLVNWNVLNCLFMVAKVFSTALNSGVCDGLNSISSWGFSITFMISELLWDSRLSC